MDHKTPGELKNSINWSTNTIGELQTQFADQQIQLAGQSIK